MRTVLALVTGASSSMGLSLARELALRGYELMVCSAGTRFDESSAELAAHGNKVVPVQANFATRGGVNELWAQVEAHGANLDLACLNAGAGVGGLFQGNRSGRRAQSSKPELLGYGAVSNVRSAAYAEAGAGTDSFHRIYSWRDNRAPGSRLSRWQSLLSIIRPQPPLRVVGGLDISTWQKPDIPTLQLHIMFALSRNDRVMRPIEMSV